MKSCLRFFSLIFLISPNLAKYAYGWLPFEQNHKVEKEKKWCWWVIWCFSITFKLMNRIGIQSTNTWKHHQLETQNLNYLEMGQEMP